MGVCETGTGETGEWKVNVGIGETPAQGLCSGQVGALCGQLIMTRA